MADSLRACKTGQGEDILMTQASFKKVSPVCKQGKDCEKKIFKWLLEYNLRQDSESAAFKDNRRHFNVEVGGDAQKAIGGFKQYLAGERKAFDNLLARRITSADTSYCEFALGRLGRMTHTWQDYYAHVIKHRPWDPENPNFLIWTHDKGFSGSPQHPEGNPANHGARWGEKVQPSSWSGLFNPGQHGLGEVGGREGRRRKRAATNWVTQQYKDLLGQWAKKCCCVCPVMSEPFEINHPKKYLTTPRGWGRAVTLGWW